MASGSPDPGQSYGWTWVGARDDRDGDVGGQDGASWEYATVADRPWSRASVVAARIEALRAGLWRAVSARPGRRLHEDGDDGDTHPTLESGSELIWTSPFDVSLTIVVAVGLVIPVIALATSRLLFLSLWRHGEAMTGLLIMDSVTCYAMSLLANVPQLSCTAIFSVILPECMPIWMFIGSIITSNCFLVMPDYLLELAGGRTAVILLLSKGDEHDERAPVKMYPCCKPRRPTLTDFKLARGFIRAFGVIFPIISALELIFEYEYVLGANFAGAALDLIKALNVLKIPIIVMCSIGCNALVAIIGFANSAFQQSVDDVKVQAVLSYCQRYVLFVNALPGIARLVLVFNIDFESGDSMPQESVANLGCALCLSVGAAVVAWISRQAFIVDTGAFQDDAGMQMLTIKFCPLCGQEGVTLDTKFRRGLIGSASCSACGVNGVPAQICTRKTLPSE